MTLGLGMKHWDVDAYQVCSNNDPRLTLTYLTSRSSFASYAFKWIFFEKLIFFENCGSLSHYSHLLCLT